MARTIESPGVEIREIDLSLNPNKINVTTVLIPGFTSRGPVSEPVKVSSLSEFEQIFGLPTNAAERYFYHSVKAVFQSPADVMVYRLPYGDGNGIGTSSEYSALAFPVISYFDGGTSTYLGFESTGAYLFGKPTHIKLTEQEYLSILAGSGFTFVNNTSGARFFPNVPSLSAAGMVVLNKSQSTINTRFEGIYIGVIDNINLNPATPYDDINRVFSLNNDNVAVKDDYIQVPAARLNFALSAESTGLTDSLSEVLENAPRFDVALNKLNDTAIIGVFKLRQSVFSPDVIALDFEMTESIVGSTDSHRRMHNPNGGTDNSFFLESVDDNSTNCIVLVNPYISHKNRSTYLDANGVPTKYVRFLSQPNIKKLNASETDAEFEARVGAPQAALQSVIDYYGSTDSLFPLGDFQSADLSTKKIGNIPAKLTKMFEKLQNHDVVPLNITVEAGLGSIYANSFNPATSGYFDDTVSYDTEVNKLSASRLESMPLVGANWLAVQNEFINFAVAQRKDHLFISDPLINIFITGNNIRTLDDSTKTFSNNIYWPLKNTYGPLDNSYACAYATCARTVDPVLNQQIWIPFSGYAAAIMATTDSNYQPWFAPAGFKRGQVIGVTDIAFYPQQKQRDLLYKIPINPVAYFPAEGFVIFGQKTMQKKPSAFDRINVRRLFLALEISVRDTIKYFLFEPNTLFTRTQVVNTLQPIFEQAKNTQGLYDYLIICDERNNTPDVIDDNAMVVDIYLKPVKTTEFILCNFYATRTGTNFQEIVS